MSTQETNTVNLWVLSTPIKLKWLSPKANNLVIDSGAVKVHTMGNYLYFMYKNKEDRAKAKVMLSEIAEVHEIDEPFEMDRSDFKEGVLDE